MWNIILLFIAHLIQRTQNIYILAQHDKSDKSNIK